MTVCALTMVYKDYWALAQWVRHYSKELGVENLYVVSHGHDPKINDIAVGANIWTIPRDNLERFDRRRYWMLNKFQAGLLKFFDWVIRTDADELVCVDPSIHGSVAAMLDAQSDDAVFGMGLDLFEDIDDTELTENVFECRRSVVISGNYSKAFAVRSEIPLVRHGVKIATGKRTTHSYAFPEGVYLVHLKFASMASLLRSNETRKALGQSDLEGMPGFGWEQADRHARKFYTEAEKMDVQPWNTATAEALSKIKANMKFSEGDGVVKAPGIPRMARTELPDWFQNGSDQ